MTVDPYHVTQDDAVALASCPRCKQPAGAMCVYMPNKYPYRPTKVVHPERREIIRKRRREAEAWERQECDKLRRWLGAWGHVLFQPRPS